MKNQIYFFLVFLASIALIYQVTTLPDLVNISAEDAKGYGSGESIPLNHNLRINLCTHLILKWLCYYFSFIATIYAHSKYTLHSSSPSN